MTILLVGFGMLVAGVLIGIGAAMCWADRTIGRGMCKRG